MTALDRCANIGLQISQRNKLRRAHKDAEAFRARAGDLKNSRELVEDAIERVVVLRKKDVVVAMLPSPDAAITVLAECQAKLAANPVESGSDYGRLKRSVDKFGKDLLGIAEKALKSVRQDLPTVDEVFLKAGGRSYLGMPIESAGYVNNGMLCSMGMTRVFRRKLLNSFSTTARRCGDSLMS